MPLTLTDYDEDYDEQDEDDEEEEDEDSEEEDIGHPLYRDTSYEDDDEYQEMA